MVPRAGLEHCFPTIHTMEVGTVELLPFQSKVVVARQGKGMVGDLVLLGMKHDPLQGLERDCLLVPLGEVKKFVLCRKLTWCLSSLEFWRHGEFPRLKPVFA